MPYNTFFGLFFHSETDVSTVFVLLLLFVFVFVLFCFVFVCLFVLSKTRETLCQNLPTVDLEYLINF